MKARKALVAGSTLALVAMLWTAAFLFATPEARNNAADAISTSVPSASANPDYVCIKSVTNQPCNVTSCGPWVNKSRVCSGTQVTYVASYLVRTTCEPGYSQVGLGGNSGAASGRQGSDYTYSTSSCSIVQVDNTPPISDPTSN